MKLNGTRGLKKPSFFIIGASGILALTLSGCVPLETKQAQPTTSAITPTIPKTSPSPSGTTEEAGIIPDPGGTNLTCEEALSPQDLYELNPNLALIPNVKLGLTSETTAIASLSGVTCQISNLSQPADIEVAFVKLTGPSARTLEKQLSSDSGFALQPVGEDLNAYFSLVNGIGQIQFVSKNYWVAISSKTFSSSVDSTSIAGIVKKNLKN